MSDKNQDSVAEFNEKTKKYGTAYAVFGEALGGDSLKTTVKIVQYALVAVAVFVVLAAVWARIAG
ncbi:hypothetical protein [Rubrimonas sp.]|uniref:hypothetical protein n=1 Tax=Rubrimonas sp. TaxID=2036015 RepID=UPI002FDC9028